MRNRAFRRANKFRLINKARKLLDQRWSRFGDSRVPAKLSTSKDAVRLGYNMHRCKCEYCSPRYHTQRKMHTAAMRDIQQQLTDIA
jgi:hypothetical protein